MDTSTPGTTTVTSENVYVRGTRMVHGDGTFAIADGPFEGPVGPQ